MAGFGLSKRLRHEKGLQLSRARIVYHRLSSEQNNDKLMMWSQKKKKRKKKKICSDMEIFFGLCFARHII